MKFSNICFLTFLFYKSLLCQETKSYRKCPYCEHDEPTKQLDATIEYNRQTSTITKMDQLPITYVKSDSANRNYTLQDTISKNYFEYLTTKTYKKNKETIIFDQKNDYDNTIKNYSEKSNPITNNKDNVKTTNSYTKRTKRTKRYTKRNKRTTAGIKTSGFTNNSVNYDKTININIKENIKPTTISNIKPSSYYTSFEDYLRTTKSFTKLEKITNGNEITKKYTPQKETILKVVGSDVTSAGWLEDNKITKQYAQTTKSDVEDYDTTDPSSIEYDTTFSKYKLHKKATKKKRKCRKPTKGRTHFHKKTKKYTKSSKPTEKVDNRTTKKDAYSYCRGLCKRRCFISINKHMYTCKNGKVCCVL